ncbi:MAG TPA: hypothetical protein VFC19_17965 [Candidatus Limnocylindrales bacterium]|nr:hypothetical protein [Candidatus Limnocylindrales bacterium]
MSSIASVYIAKQADLPEIAAAGLGRLGELATQVEDAFDWSGRVLYFLIESLEEQGIQLSSAEFGDVEEALEAFVIGPDRKVLLPQLDPEANDPAEIRAWLADWDMDFEEAGDAGFDALTMLHEQISALPDDSVLIVHITS